MAVETIIDLLRHGEPVGGSRYRGNRIDDPLTAKGWQQMHQGIGTQAPWGIIISSPLIRCSAFAQQLSSNHDIPLEIVTEFKEIGFGEWEGKTRQDLINERPDEFAAFYDDPVTNTPENAESVIDFFSRIAAAVEKVRVQYSGKHLLIIAHAGVIRAAVTNAIGAPAGCMYNFNIANGKISRIRYTKSRTNLELINANL